MYSFFTSTVSEIFNKLNKCSDSIEEMLMPDLGKDYDPSSQRSAIRCILDLQSQANKVYPHRTDM